MQKGWTKRTELVVTHKVAVYTGPPLPFVRDHTLYLEIAPCNKHHDLDLAIEPALEKLGLEETYAHFDWTEASRSKMYYAPPRFGHHFYLVQVELWAETGEVQCTQCQFTPPKCDYDKAYLCVPLNPEVWSEWVCPSCALLASGR